MPEKEIAIRRVKASDAENIAAFLNQALPGDLDLDRATILTRLGDVGFFVAEQDGQIVGVLGWQMENLVARVTDFLVYPAHKRSAAGEALFSAMEVTATDLQGEAVLLFLPRGSADGVVEFCESLGYAQRVVGDLPRVWREAASEADYSNDDKVLVKKLRADRVASPL